MVHLRKPPSSIVNSLGREITWSFDQGGQIIAASFADDRWTLEAHVAGRLPIPTWECFFGVNDCSLREITFYVVVLRRGDKVGIIDAGLPIDEPSRRYLNEACQTVDPECYFRDVRLLPEILSDAQIEPADIDFLLVSQPITYATGGMTSELFPRAEIYVARDGLEEFLYEAPGHPPRQAYFTPATWGFLFDAITEGRLRAVGLTQQVAEGLTFTVTGGHHPGSAAVTVALDQGPLTLVETAFLQENIEKDLPIGIAENAARARSAVRSFVSQGHTTLALRDPDLAERLSRLT